MLEKANIMFLLAFDDVSSMLLVERLNKTYAFYHFELYA